ncbi:MAG: xylose isomerase [Paenibacillus sp.]|nr:xylose isomerase [Paenibacillus sp.]
MLMNKLAIQLYTLREECANNFPQVLRDLKQLGWAGVQMAGYHNYDPEELASVIREQKLQTAGLHVGLGRITDELDELIKEARLFRTRDIICPSIPLESRTEAGYRNVKQLLGEAAVKLKQHGLRLSYHNHAFEFETAVEGESALEYLLNPSDDNLILAEIDVYWVKKAGLEPAAFIQRYAGRMPIIHLKDMSDDDEQIYAEIGTGSIDFRPILQWGEASGIEWYVVEQDTCRRDPMDCVMTSLTNLKQLIAERQAAN